MARGVAILAVGAWGRRVARNIAKDRRFKIVSLIANFTGKDEVWQYAMKKAELPAQNGISKEEIRELLVDHGLVPSMMEIEGEEEADTPDAHKNTVDIAVVDMGSEINRDIIEKLLPHVEMKILAHAANSDEKNSFEKMGALAVCPDIDGCGADHVTPLLIKTHIRNMWDELGGWHGAVMPVPACWTGKSVAAVEEKYGVNIVLVRSQVLAERKGKRKEMWKETFNPSKSYLFREEDEDMKLVSKDYECILKVEEEIDK